MIEGDNFHSLSVLNYTHIDSVDIIYIDPPYNRGKNDFIYNDKFVNAEDGYRHSKWLNFMQKRLKLARTLLKEDGLIFISIDDYEFAQLKMLCDKIFGEEQVNWNKFINFWARHFDKHSVDNILTLYSYNPSGTVFYTFNEWNSEKIDRRIKPRSKGIPILNLDYKYYVFDIRQTYGKEYKEWKYYHIIDNEILEFYKDKYKISFANTNVRDDIYNVFHQIIGNKIKDNYIDLKDNEVEFIVDTMTSLFLSKNTFSLNHLKNNYNNI